MLSLQSKYKSFNLILNYQFLSLSFTHSILTQIPYQIPTCLKTFKILNIQSIMQHSQNIAQKNQFQLVGQFTSKCSPNPIAQPQEDKIDQKSPKKQPYFEKSQKKSLSIDSNGSQQQDLLKNDSNPIIFKLFPTSRKMLFQYTNYMCHGLSAQNLSDPISQIRNLIEDEEELNLIQQHIFKNNIFSKSQTFSQELSVLSIQTTKYSQVAILQVHYGFYKTKITILNYSSKQNVKSPLKDEALLYSFGSFGQIYAINKNDQSYAIKSNLFCPAGYTISQRVKFIMLSIQEYFFLLLFSELQIGPKARKCFGFDLVVYKDSIQFSMELCSEIQFCFQLDHSLIKSLRTMHRLKIVHRDIKNKNIMYSKEFKKPVFIDFGGTAFIRQNLGYRSKSRFVGTTGYCSNEMLRIFNQGVGYADLYYNDYHGLKKSIAQISTYLKQQIEDNEISQRSDMIQELKSMNEILQLDVRLMNYFLLTKDKAKLDQQKIKMKKLYPEDFVKIQYKILYFIIDLFKNPFTQAQYKRVRQEVRNLTQFQKLKDIYKDQFSRIFQNLVDFQFKKQAFSEQIKLYQHIYIYHRNLPKFQEQIEIFSLSKQAMEDFLQFPYLTDDFFEKPHNELIYLIICIRYCTLFNDKFKISLQRKIWVSQIVLKIFKLFLQKINLQSPRQTKPTIQCSELIFECPFKDLTSIALLYQQIMFNQWKKIPEKFQAESIQIIIGSLAFLGYPLYIYDAKYIFFYYLVQVQSSGYQQDKQNAASLAKNQPIEKIEKKLNQILLFWKCLGAINVFNIMFYDKKYGNLKISEQTRLLIVSKTDIFVSNLLKPIEGLPNVFSSINSSFFNDDFNFQIDCLLVNQNQLSEKTYYPNLVMKDINWDGYWKQWIKCLYHVKDMIPFHQTETTSQVDHKYKIENQEQLELFFKSYVIYFSNYCHYSRVQTILKIMDENLVCQRINKRIFIDKRLIIAWKNEDIHQLHSLCQTVLQKQQFSISNFLQITQILNTVYPIIVEQLKNNSVNLVFKFFALLFFQKISLKVQEFIDYFTQQHNLMKTLRYECQQDILYPKVNYYSKMSQKAQIVQNCLYKSLSHRRIFLTFYHQFLQVIEKIPNSQQKLIKYYHEMGIKNMNQQKCIKQLLEELIEQKIKIKRKEEQSQAHAKKILQYLRILPIFKWDSSNLGSLSNRTMFQIHLMKEGQNQQMAQIFEINFKNKFSIDDILKMPNSKQFVKIPIFYITLKITSQKNPDIHLYQQLIRCYHHWIYDYQFYQFLFKIPLFQALFDALIICYEGFQQLERFLIYLTRELKKYPQNLNVKVFNVKLLQKMRCSLCNQHTKFNDKRLHKFVWHLFQNISFLNPQNDTYMAFVYVTSLPNEWIPLKIRRRFFVFVIQAIEFMNSEAKKIIMQRIYVEGFFLKMRTNFSLNGIRSIKIIQERKKAEKKLLQSFIRCQSYYTRKYYKTTEIFQPQDAADKNLKYKRLRKKRQRIPKRIQDIYLQKMKRYNQVRMILNH